MRNQAASASCALRDSTQSRSSSRHTGSVTAPAPTSASWKSRMRKSFAQPGLGFGTDGPHAAITDLIGKAPVQACRCSDRPRHAAWLSASTCCRPREVDRLITCPVLGMDAGVDDEAAGAPDLHLQAAIMPGRRVVHARTHRPAIRSTAPSLRHRTNTRAPSTTELGQLHLLTRPVH